MSLSVARHYVKALERSGHTCKIVKGLSGRAGSFDTWTLVNYTGPDAPLLHRNRTGVYDPNTKIHHGGEDEKAG